MKTSAMLVALVLAGAVVGVPAAAGDRLGTTAIRVLDRQEIERLHYMLGYYMDNSDWQSASLLFDENASFEMDGEGLYLGKARIAARLRLDGDGPTRGRLAQTLMMQPLITLARDGRTARARFRGLEMQAEYQQQARWGEGVYENEYVKRDGVWKIARLHFIRTFRANYAGGWTDGALPLPGPRADLPADRGPSLVYPVYPAPYTPPLHKGADK